MKTVGYDHQVFFTQNFGGISRYFCELIKHSKGFFNYSIGGVFSDNYYTNELGFHHSFPIKIKNKGRMQILLNLILQKYNDLDTINKLKKKCDIYHPTYYNPRLIHKTDKPVVLTVHDMIYELTPGDFPIDNVIITQKQLMILNATEIIAISENTKKDVLKFYPQIPEDKISVIYHGTSMSKYEIKEKQPYILFTGERYFYKNFNNFILAVAPLLTTYNLQLKCTGRPFLQSEIELLKQLNILERTSVQFANEDELKELYANALCFVFPSMYEGFGIPILEAFACGCPLVLSDASCFPEIAADAGIYFDPYSIEDMRKKIEHVICSDTLRNDFMKKGFERLEIFSWRKCTEQTAKVYERVI